MAQYFTPRNLNAFAQGYYAFNELGKRYDAAKEVGAILRQRYNRYYYTGSLKRKYSKPLGASNTTAIVRKRSARSRKMPISRSYRRRGRRMMRKRMVRRVPRKARWQAKARRMVGNPRNYSTSKTTESQLPGVLTTVATSTVSARGLIQISGTSINSINARQRDTCIINGIRMDLTFENLLNDRIYINWAVIHAKQGQNISSTTPDFFRSYGSERSFNADASATVTGLSYSVAQINTDEFLVLKRGKFMLTPAATLAGDVPPRGYNYGAATKEIKCWMKVGRQFYFDDGSAEPQDQLTFVCWASNPSDGTGTVASAFRYRLRAICYWREPRGG